MISSDAAILDAYDAELGPDPFVNPPKWWVWPSFALILAASWYGVARLVCRVVRS